MLLAESSCHLLHCLPPLIIMKAPKSAFEYGCQDLVAQWYSYDPEMQVRFRKHVMRLHVLLNYSFLLFLCSENLGITIMNIITQLSPLLIHLPTQKELGCNGHVEFCNRSYSHVTQIATHGSPFVGILPMDNQNVHISKQLDAGIRFLQAQTHLDASGTLSLCHTNCGMKDAGSVADYLSTIKTWLGTHPKEVVTILLTNGDYANITEYSFAFNVSGIIPYAYTPIPTHKSTDLTTWPTLGSLISTNKRLIAFLDAGADSPHAHTLAPYLLPEFTYFWETPFDTVDPSFSQCAIDRPEDIRERPEKVRQRMYIVNHFLDTQLLGMVVPNRRDAEGTNGRVSLGGQVERCRGEHGVGPKAVLVDYFERGEWREVQDSLNSV